MEKFAVDLDAVLDEFEFHEDQAERQSKIPCPTDTGFFSPSSEEAPVILSEQSSASTTTSKADGHLTPSPQPPTDVSIRYDLPPSPAAKVLTNSEIEDMDKSDAITNDVENNVNGDITHEINKIEDEIENNDEKHVVDGISDIKTVNEEVTIENSASTTLLNSRTRQNDDYVDSQEVEEYLKQIKNEEENYVDEHEVEKYLKEINLEKSEQNLLNKVSSEDENDDYGDSKQIVIDKSDIVDSEVGQEVETAPKPKNDNDVDHFMVDSSIPCNSESLSDLERDLEPTIQTTISQETLENCSATNNEASGHREVSQATFVEEEVYVDLDSLTQDLEPQITRSNVSQAGGANDAIDENDDNEGSPPPYSELDPLANNRPNSLDLSGDVNETSGDVVLGAPGATPVNPGGPRGQSSLLAGLSEDQLLLGKVQPYWVPDAEANNCMICSIKFTMVKRRHHCRACGKVLCGSCCSDKHPLVYLEGKEGRVCTPCKHILTRLDQAELTNQSAEGAESGRAGGARQPNPANPMEYCSTVPVAEQVRAAGAMSTPSVMVPVGVLKRQGASVTSSIPGGATASNGAEANKSVMFSDGIRPGGDLTELDGRDGHRTLGKRPGGRGRSGRRSRRGVAGPAGGQDVAASMLPPEGLPLVSGRGAVDVEEVIVWFSAGTNVSFVINKNMTVITKQLTYPPLNNKLVWNFATRGLNSVGQDEVVILLEVEDGELVPPRDVFTMLQALYEQAGAGTPVTEMGHISVSSSYLGSNAHGGWIFIRQTHQTIQDILLPPPPVLFAVLIMRWEIPWARVFPLRLMLRLGAEFRYYPSPLVSVRSRPAVYGEIGHTIMNVLSDFKNYTYAMPTIRGMVIHMTTGATDICLPKNRYQAVLKALNTSNETVLALGATFSSSADSHLVTIQQEDGSYQTQAINICNKERKLTGASFVVFNGALKTSANLTAKSSIVEDGLMVQVLPDDMVSIRKSLHNMENHTIGCGHTGAQSPDEVVRISWVDEDKAVNIGIKSVIDGRAMDGVTSYRIHSGPEMTQEYCLIRWTEVFLISTQNPNMSQGDPPDPARASEGVARGVCVALLPGLATLKSSDLSPLAIRVSTQPDNVMYEAGSNGSFLPAEFMNSLDNELVPLLHSGALPPHLVLELVFHVLDYEPARD